MDRIEGATTPSERETMLVHFVTQLASLFARLPDLIGFSVLERATLSAEREHARLDAELSVADVSVQAWPGAHAETPAEEIAAVLAELLAEHPSARALLSGFSFARTFH